MPQVGEGKSGMLFFSTADREYIIKTVTRNELKFLEKELKSYYDYMVSQLYMHASWVALVCASHLIYACMHRW